MAEMTAKQFLKEYRRMCKEHYSCIGCEIRQKLTTDSCRQWICNNPESAISLVYKWVEENPEKTILHDFLEKYPNAELNSKGKPRFCPKNLGYEINKCCYSTECFSECWDEPLEVGKCWN